jgi:hypothetical protein
LLFFPELYGSDNVARVYCVRCSVSEERAEAGPLEEHAILRKPACAA